MIKYVGAETRSTIDKSLTAIKLQAGMLGILLLSLFLKDFDLTDFILRLAFWCGFYVLFIRSVKRLLYSFWTFVTLITLYSISFFFSPGISNLNFSEILIIFFLITLSVWMVKLFLGPSFYSKLNWWEYDFRYRNDIKAEIKTDSEPFKIRLNDVRHNEISIMCFQDLNPEKEVLIQNIDGLEGLTLRTNIATIRNNIVGRPDIVGLKVLDDESNMASFKRLKTHLDNLKLSTKKVVRYE